MHAASSKIDLFTDNATQDSLTAGTFWTNEMFRNLHLEQRQIGLIAQRRKELVRRRGSTLLDIMTLHNIKHRLKSEEETIEDQMDDLRRKLDQEKAAKIIFFCEKFKYRSEVNLFEAFSSDPSPAKKVKME